MGRRGLDIAQLRKIAAQPGAASLEDIREMAERLVEVMSEPPPRPPCAECGAQPAEVEGTLGEKLCWDCKREEDMEDLL